MTKKQIRHCVHKARKKPMVILDAINETIEIGNDEDQAFSCLVDVPGLESLRDNFKKWMTGKPALADDLVATLFMTSQFPNVRKEKERMRQAEISAFFGRR